VPFVDEFMTTKNEIQQNGIMRKRGQPVIREIKKAASRTPTIRTGGNQQPYAPSPGTTEGKEEKEKR